MQITMQTIPLIPAHDAAATDFYFPEVTRAEAVAWARERVADCQHHSDEDLIRACRVLIMNSPEDHSTASNLLSVLRKDAA